MVRNDITGALTLTGGRFLKDTGGAITIPALVIFTALMAVGGLAIDLQRFYGVHGQMQAYVDQVALAAAAELDALPGALARSVDAATGVVGSGSANGPLLTGTGWQQFADNPTLAVRKLIFFSQLGSPDPSPTDPAEPYAVDAPYVLCTVDLAAALPACVTSPSNNVLTQTRFVEILAAPRTVSYLVVPVADVILGLFGQSITSSATLSLRATAGYKASVCDLTPMMICNPDEPATNTNPNFPFNATARVGQQILIKSGGGSYWAPGDFGWLDPPDDAGISACQQGGHQDLGCLLGLVNPLTQCINDNTTGIKPGNAVETANGLNTRFDIYPNSDNLGPAHNVHTDARFAPSVNITKGVCATRTQGGTKTCNYSTPAARCPNPNAGGGSGFDLANTVTNVNARSIKMPRDNQWCDGAGNCVALPDATHRFGNGNWDRAAYWAANHGGAVLPGSLTTATRYQVYRYEIDNNLITNYSPGADVGENGNHTNGGVAKYCSTQPGVNNAARDRRVLYVAVVNCAAANLRGNSVPNVHVISYLKVFLTEPIGYNTAGTAWLGVSNAQDVYGEVVEVIKPDDPASIVHVYPVLYR